MYQIFYLVLSYLPSIHIYVDILFTSLLIANICININEEETTTVRINTKTIFYKKESV